MAAWFEPIWRIDMRTYCQLLLALLQSACADLDELSADRSVVPAPLRLEFLHQFQTLGTSD
jgi:hypothetical protein